MPSQVAVYLGFVLDTREMVFRLPEEKVAKIFDQVGVLITRRKSQHKVWEWLPWLASSRLASGPWGSW